MSKAEKNINAIKEMLFKSQMESELIQVEKKGIEYGGYESPEPGNLSAERKKILSHAYASCRKDGGDKEKCSKIAWNAVNQAGKK